MDAVLAEIGANGQVKELPHARLAYDHQDGVLYIALDHYAMDGNGGLADISPSWEAVRRYVQAAGRNPDILEIPGDRELFGPIMNFPADAVEGRWHYNHDGVLSWRVSVPLAPWKLAAYAA
jgi:hypothetical protein